CAMLTLCDPVERRMRSGSLSRGMVRFSACAGLSALLALAGCGGGASAPGGVADSAQGDPGDALEEVSSTDDAGDNADGAAELDAGEAAASDAPGPGGTLAPCESGSDCHSGLCVAGPDGLVCTRRCDGDCPVGYVCLASRPGTDSGFICVYEHVSY